MGKKNQKAQDGNCLLIRDDEYRGLCSETNGLCSFDAKRTKSMGVSIPPYPLNDLAGAIIATGVRWRQGGAIVLRLFRSAPRDVFVLCVAIYLYVYRVRTACLCSGCALKKPQNGGRGARINAYRFRAEPYYRGHSGSTGEQAG